MVLKTFVMAATSSRMTLYILSADGNFDAAYKGSQLANKEMKASLALPVCLQTRKGVVRDRPTQGWTVEEASLLCTCPEGQMNPAHETYSFRSQTQLPRIANAEHPLSLSRILNYIWCFDFFFVCLVGSLIWGRRECGRECFLSKKKFLPVFHSVDPNR